MRTRSSILGPTKIAGNNLNDRIAGKGRTGLLQVFGASSHENKVCSLKRQEPDECAPYASGCARDDYCPICKTDIHVLLNWDHTEED